MSLDRIERRALPGHDSGIKRAVNKRVWAEQLGQDSWDRAAGTGQPGRAARTGSQDRTARQNSWYRTAWTGQPGQGSQDRTARPEKPGQEIWNRKCIKTDGIIQPG